MRSWISNRRPDHDVHRGTAPHPNVCERRLMVGILTDALRAVRGYSSLMSARERAAHLDAVEWIASRDRAGFFSFENVCAALDLDPEEIRRDAARCRDMTRTERTIESEVAAALTSPSRHRAVRSAA